MTVVELFAKLGLKVDGASFKKGEAAIGGLHSLMAGLGISLGAARAGLEAVVSGTAAAALGASKAAQRVGIARDAWTELSTAAGASGIEAESFEQAMKFLNRGIFDATHHSKEAATAFRLVGVSARDGSGHMRKADAVLMDVAERFKHMPDGPEKTALAIRLFGRAGTEMIPMLNRGKEAISELRAEAHELGLVFSDEDVEAAKEYKLAQHDLHESILGLKYAIGKELLPAAGGWMKEITGWIKANRQWIATKIHSAVTLLGAALHKVRQILDPFIAAARWLVSQTWLWKVAVTALAIVLAIQFGSAVRDAVLGLGKMLGMLRAVTASQILGAAAAAATALAWAAGIALVLMAIEELYGWITGDRATLLEDWLGPFSEFIKIKPSDSGLLATLKEVLAVANDIGTAFQKIRAAWGGDVGKMLGEGGADAPWRADMARRQAEMDEQGRRPMPWVADMNAKWSGGSPASAPPGNTSTTSVGQITVTVPAPVGSDPVGFGKRVAEEIQKALQGEYNAAHAAVVR